MKRLTALSKKYPGWSWGRFCAEGNLRDFAIVLAHFNRGLPVRHLPHERRRANWWNATL